MLDACRSNPFRNFNRDNNEKGFAVVAKNPKGSLIAFATKPGDVASDGSEQNSPYTTAWLKNLKTNNLSIYDILTNIRSDVYNNSGNRQEPWFNSSLPKAFYFKGKQENIVIINDQPDRFVDTRDNYVYKSDFVVEGC